MRLFRRRLKISLRSFSLLMVLLASSTLSAQHTATSSERNNKIQKATKLLETHLYKDAINFSKSLLTDYPNDPEVNLVIGLSYINVGNQPDSAVYFLQEGIKFLNNQSDDLETRLNLMMSLGKAYQFALKPQAAIDIYRKICDLVSDGNQNLLDEIAHEVQTCENAKLFLEHPIAMNINNLGAGINSSFDDHTPLVSVKGDQIVFTSRRAEENLSVLEDGQYPEKICTSTCNDNLWQQSKLLKFFFKKSDHESAVSISPDGKQMFLFKNDPDGKNLYVSRKNGSDWGVPVKLPEPINSYSQETHCSLSADGSTLFFTSDREGGFGGLDIYMAKKLQNGNWGDARNLGPNINSQFNEETPMVFLDGKTLYFASEGHNSMGMFDIFYSQMLADSTWTEPINLGYPINTPDDDLFFVPTIERNKAYYASSHFKDNIGGLDIYLIEFDPLFKGKLAVIEGKVNQSGKEKTIRILVSRASDQQLVGDYRPDPVSGEYTMFLETGQDYQIKHVKQITFEEEVGKITVGDDMAYENYKMPVKMRDMDIEPPLIPAELLMVKRVKTPDVVPVNSPISTENIIGIPTQTAVISTNPELPTFVTETGYTVQLLALRTKRVRNYKIFKGLDASKIRELACIDGFYRYTYSTFDSLDSSLLARKTIIETSKFKDAFVRPISQLEQLKIASGNK